MRLTYYITASVAAAGGVVIDAFNRRPNFYSATVYLAQTPLCYMVLANFVFLCHASIVYGLQRALFGDLRIIERERLWERGWISVTETLLIMMTFRDDVGGWFLFVLANLVVARMWAWLAEGRIEMLEQQPPANPRTFHARLSASLTVCCLANFGFLKYCVDTVLEQAKPGMMVMFAFEFAVLTISSCSNLLRYCIALYEIRVVQQQTKARIEARREEIRTERAAAETRARDNEDESTEPSETLARLEREENNISEDDIDVPGWEDKGRWVFALDIMTDFLRLVVYLAFFSVLMIFHGIPIHIVRDVYITLHSFLKRIWSFWQYRTATKDMNTRYPDATAEELERENTCIVCREEMRPWPAEGQQPMEQRLRAKKLPCGHILHFGCLRSWLERQQVCPTCRRPVLDPLAIPTGSGARNAPERPQHPAPPGLQGADGIAPPLGQPHARDQPRDDRAAGNAQGPAQGQGQARGQNPMAQWRPRVLNLGPLRIALGTMPADALNMLQRGQLNGMDGAATTAPTSMSTTNTNTNAPTYPAGSPAGIEHELMQIERELSRQIMELNMQQQQLGLVRMLQSELARLRAMHAQAQVMYQAPVQPPPTTIMPQMGAGAGPSTAAASSDTVAQSQLPPGLTLPEGWTLLPLTRTDVPPQTGPTGTAAEINPSSMAAANTGPSATVTATAHPQPLRPTPTIPLSALSDPTLATSQPPSRPSSTGQRTASPAFPAEASNGSDAVSLAAHEHPSNVARDSTRQPSQPSPLRTSETSAYPPPAPAPSMTAPAPTWSFGTPAENEESKEESFQASSLVNDGEQSSQQPDAEHTSQAANGSASKGKGRAVTIEDEPEVD